MTASLTRGASSIARNNELPAVALRIANVKVAGRRLLMIAPDFPPARGLRSGDARRDRV